MKRIKTGGRAKGTPNKATADIKALAQNYGEFAVAVLAAIAATSPSDQARVAAVKELLDRGYGKPTQAVAAAIVSAPLITRIERVIVDPSSDRRTEVRR
ncbi:MAG: hypothetical protein P4L72_12000 [Parvibaculum sp.]|uniref:hypothetical protein n=1 Tax=Parvibaculum sp. TaxID=2024848 RepID=UPI002845ED31|nr:hypothetical protein [Parvibaculum sp.]MDR3499934.1 hypothetical protein [Parvibaculum sp.]